MVSKKRIVMLLMLGVIVATTVVLAVYAPAQAQSYPVSSGSTGAKTGAELGLFAVAGAALLGAGYFLTRKSKA
jgi:LPXTG-motif cell wall-anchored protein